MAIDGKLMAKARERLEKIKQENAKVQEERLLEVYTRVPEVRAADARLRAIMGELISASLKKGEAAKAEIDSLSRRSLEICGEKSEALVEAGYPFDYLDEVCSCPVCRDTGYTAKGENCPCLMKLYEEGVKLAARCAEELESAKRKIQILQSGKNGEIEVVDVPEGTFADNG